MAVNTGSGSNDEVISKVCKEKFNNIVLKEEQLSAVRSLLEGTDVLAVLPTGFGKSVIFRFVTCYYQNRGRFSFLIIRHRVASF